MTEFHAENLRRSILEQSQAFDRAEKAGDWRAAQEAWLRLLMVTDTAIGEALGARIEADALAAELLVYRPTRHQRPAAPALSGYVYVFTGKAPWVCAAVEIRKLVRITTRT